MAVSTEQFDAIVVGGGPGGSTVASFVAMQGHRVLLLDKEKFPVYKVGESLLPSTIHGICKMLGVSEEIERAGFVRKQGGTFRWGRNKDPWTFAFSQSEKFQGPTSYAYQVERLKFDSILLNNARRKGVEVREGHKVLNLDVQNGRVSGVNFCDRTGKVTNARAQFVVDASGHTSAIARYAGERMYSEFFRNIAIFGYYQNGKRLPSPCAGNIFCVAFDLGWFWYIPLSPTLTSVGAVIGQEHSSILHNGPETALTELIGSCRAISELLCQAHRLTTGPYGEVRVRKDYSYIHTRFWQPGLVLVGDAACFIDPVFSSGVHLATYSALLAARSINTCLCKELTEERAFTEFETRYRREYKLFYDFLVAFYDVNQDLDSYYWAARKVVNSAEADNEAFIQLVGGIAGSGERLYASGRDFMQAREGLGKSLFPSAEPSAPETSSQGAQRRQEREKFMAALTAEGAQMQLRGILGNVNSHEMAIVPDGLMPSSDGLRWRLPSVQQS